MEIFSDEFLKENLAFRGGTALHKLYLNPAPRYSGISYDQNDAFKWLKTELIERI